jgi:hypothetical protein
LAAARAIWVVASTACGTSEHGFGGDFGRGRRRFGRRVLLRLFLRGRRLVAARRRGAAGLLVGRRGGGGQRDRRSGEQGEEGRHLRDSTPPSVLSFNHGPAGR